MAYINPHVICLKKKKALGVLYSSLEIPLALSTLVYVHCYISTHIFVCRYVIKKWMRESTHAWVYACVIFFFYCVIFVYFFVFLGEPITLKMIVVTSVLCRLKRILIKTKKKNITYQRNWNNRWKSKPGKTALYIIILGCTK